MVLTVDERHLGTPESDWQRCGRLEAVAPLWTQPWRRVIVVAPHPDDEVLGAGGLLRHLSSVGTPIHVVAVTDGEGSHPGSPAAAAIDLRARRAHERNEALKRLTGASCAVSRLRFPDGAVSSVEQRLCESLTKLLRPGDLCVAPWSKDGHPDHDSTGRAARAAASAQACDLLGYLVWAWHWANADADDLPWASCRRLQFSRRDAARKRWATAAFASQIRPLGPDRHDGPVLPDPVLRRSWRRSEVFVVEQAS